jgi:hypothetical protein
MKIGIGFTISFFIIICEAIIIVRKINTKSKKIFVQGSMEDDVEAIYRRSQMLENEGGPPAGKTTTPISMEYEDGGQGDEGRERDDGGEPGDGEGKLAGEPAATDSGSVDGRPGEEVTTGSPGPGSGSGSSVCSGSNLQERLKLYIARNKKTNNDTIYKPKALSTISVIRAKKLEAPCLNG